MRTNYVIEGICEQLKLVYDRISKLSGMTSSLLAEQRADILDENEEMLIAELEQAQKLTLTLTREILGTDVSEEPGENEPLENSENSDGDSAFAEGELTAGLGDKTGEKGEQQPEEKPVAQPDGKK